MTPRRDTASSERAARRAAARPSAAARPAAAPPAPPAQAEAYAFRCSLCHEPIGDPLYVGPWGHAPPGVCFTCWVNAFEDRAPRDWGRRMVAVWLMANGYTQTEAAMRVGVRERRIRKWRMRLAKNPLAFLRALEDMDAPPGD